MNEDMNEDTNVLTLEQLCSVCALERDWLVVRVQEGLIPAQGESDSEWRFTTTTVSRVRRKNSFNVGSPAKAIASPVAKPTNLPSSSSRT